MDSTPPSRRTRNLASATLAVVLILPALACERSDDLPAPGTTDGPPSATADVEPVGTETGSPKDDWAHRARAVLNAAEGTDATGTVALTATDESDEVLLEIELDGLEPGPHGFHLHENGDCSAGDFTSAGGHFAPGGSPHGAPDSPDHHAGDLGNVTADEQGRVSARMSTTELSLLPPDQNGRSAIGRAIVVHAGEDDLESQPSGDAGDRVLCGVVERDDTMARSDGSSDQPVTAELQASPATSDRLVAEGGASPRG